MPKQKIALSLPGPEPTVDVNALVLATVRPLQQQIADLQTQIKALQQPPVKAP